MRTILSNPGAFLQRVTLSEAEILAGDLPANVWWDVGLGEPCVILGIHFDCASTSSPYYYSELEWDTITVTLKSFSDPVADSQTAGCDFIQGLVRTNSPAILLPRDPSNVGWWPDGMEGFYYNEGYSIDNIFYPTFGWMSSDRQGRGTLQFYMDHTSVTWPPPGTPATDPVLWLTPTIWYLPELSVTDWLPTFEPYTSPS